MVLKIAVKITCFLAILIGKFSTSTVRDLGPSEVDETRAAQGTRRAQARRPVTDERRSDAKRIGNLATGEISDSRTTSHSMPGEPPLYPAPPAVQKQYNEVLTRLRETSAKEIFSFAEYGGRMVVENSDLETRVGAAFTRTAMLLIDQPAIEVFDKYMAALKPRRLKVITGAVTLDSAYIAFREPEDGFMRTITLVDQGKRTLVVVSVTDPNKMLQTSPNDNSPFNWPTLSLLEKPVDIESVDSKAIQRTRYAVTTCQNVKDASSFYVERLSAQGWNHVKSASTEQSDAWQELFERDDESCQLSVTAARRTASACSITAICVSRR